MKFIALGRVTRPFGIRGEVRVRPYNPDTTWFEKAQGVWLRSDPGREPEYRRLIRSRPHKDCLVLTIEGVCDRDQSEKIRGMEVVAPADQLGPLEEGEYYWHQLIGLKVVTDSGKSLGEVVRMEPTAPHLGGSDNLVVFGDQGEMLIPAAEGVVEEVDLEAGRIIVRSIPGLTGE